jgi:inositol-phosphate phosphatase / L-galactose 1-phosphate phosphatase / histidinol-phosphatase
MNKIITTEIIDFANHLADLSAVTIKKYFRKDFGEQNKLNNTPVTIADKETEEVIRKAIRKKFPDHGIIGEEMEDTDIDADYKWVIDPIDGTTSFVIGKPIFGTLIALTYKGEALLGIINQPITGERWVGIKGEKAKLNNKIIQTRKCENLRDAILCTTSPVFFKSINSKIFKAITARTKYQKFGGAIYGGDCYLFGLLALGFIDVVIEYGLNNYDYMALIPIVKSAGGVITDWKGAELEMKSGGMVLACGDAVLHKKIVQLIKDTTMAQI